jgi:protein subunit release factor A
MEQFKRLSREHAEVSDVVSLFQEYLQAERDAGEARDMASEASMKVYADEELKKARASMEQLEARLQKALLPRDPNDDRNLFLRCARGPAATSRRCSPAICSACTRATPSARAGRSRSSRRASPSSAATRK